MNKLLAAVMSACFAVASASAMADDMKKDGMKKDEMKKDGMEKK